MKIKAVILCASAMSSGLIVDSVKKIAKNKGMDVDIECFASLRYKYYDYSDLDIVVFAPQVKSQLPSIKEYINNKGYDIPMYIIPMREYGLVKGEEILNAMIKEISDYKKEV